MKSLLRFTYSRCNVPRCSINSNFKVTSSGNISRTNSYSRIVQSYPAFNNRAGHPKKSKVCMSTAFAEFRRKAEDILPEHTDNETTSRVAFHLMERELELENEKKLEVLEIKMEKDNEKKLEVLEIKMEMEKKLELQEMKQRQSTAFHSKQLSAVVQRLVVCMSVCILNLFVLLLFRHLPHHFFASSFLCCVVIQTSCRELSEKCRRRLQERYRSDL